MDKEYKVAAGRSVTARGVVFGPGAVLPAEALSAESVQVLLKNKIIVEAGNEAKAPAQAGKAAKEEAAPNKGGEKKRK